LNTYFDTGVLVKAYVVETGTREALALIYRTKPPIPLTPLHAIEILHVAAALEIGCKEFVSFDKRQRSLASLEKLKILPVSN